VDGQEAHEKTGGRRVKNEPAPQDPLQAVLRVELQLLDEDLLEIVDFLALFGRDEARHATEGLKGAVAAAPNVE